jgi:thiosulfate/3-mercaptopyruvate sulfurtransferase
MTSATASPLVSPALLAQKLTDPELLVLDIRSAESAGRAALENADVQGAVHSDYAADGWRVQTRGADCLLPNPDDFAELFGRLGIAPERHTVIVSAGLTPADFSAAARVYWTLKVAGHGPVSILDGGYASWVSANLPVTAGPSIP